MPVSFGNEPAILGFVASGVGTPDSPRPRDVDPVSPTRDGARGTMNTHPFAMLTRGPQTVRFAIGRPCFPLKNRRDREVL